jgi:serine/threonine protein kinase
LKPDNIVLNLEPLNVVVIDFDASCLDSTKTISTIKGTKGYYPNWKGTRDGKEDWDIWALGAMILEANLPPDEYYNVNSE